MEWSPIEIIMGPGLIVLGLVVYVVKADARGKRREQRELEEREAHEQEPKPASVKPTNSEWVDGYVAAQRETERDRPN
jgi:hypothetical protein